MSSREELLAKIKTLSETIWDRRAREPYIQSWLSNFDDTGNGATDQQHLHALYLLSQFMYFGSRQMRELMRVLFRDLYRYPIVQDIRKANGDTTDLTLIDREFRTILNKTLFLGVGNPSESGSHLLYYFRQENGLPKSRFIHSHEIFRRTRLRKWDLVKAFVSLLRRHHTGYAGMLSLRHADVDRYVFIDDFCGSGHQGVLYSKDVVDDIKNLNASAHVSYFVLCGTESGIQRLRQETSFDVVRCVFELDESFRCFSPQSRYFPSVNPNITRDFAEHLCRRYGAQLNPCAPLGYGNCQLLVGFPHNTPDNTLPIFWADETCGQSWTPIFRRYPKLYG